jgi:hypothetical protein
LIRPVQKDPKPRLNLDTEERERRDDDGGHVPQWGSEYHDDEQDADHDQGQKGWQDREFVVADVAHGMERINPCSQGQHDDPEADVVSGPFIEEAFCAHAQPLFQRGHEVALTLPTYWSRKGL